MYMYISIYTYPYIYIYYTVDGTDIRVTFSRDPKARIGPILHVPCRSNDFIRNGVTWNPHRPNSLRMKSGKAKHCALP